MMDKMTTAIDGNKTNMLMILNGCVGIYMYYNVGWVMPDWMMWLDASLIGGAARSAMKKGPGA